jgi:hypothetical protein
VVVYDKYACQKVVIIPCPRQKLDREGGGAAASPGALLFLITHPAPRAGAGPTRGGTTPVVHVLPDT